jgi:hypothetical protein
MTFDHGVSGHYKAAIGNRNHCGVIAGANHSGFHLAKVLHRLPKGSNFT